MEEKAELRKKLRAARLAHAASLPDAMRGLVFRHPPAPLLELIPSGTPIGLYRAVAGEAPAAAYAGFFMERGHVVALPRIAAQDGPMTFHAHSDPFGETDLVEGPMKLRQPRSDAAQIVPQVLFLPLVGFTERGDRLGQGGGHYDRWLASHRDTLTIGMAWDCQQVDELPIEPHDITLDAVVTPTRIFGPF